MRETGLEESQAGVLTVSVWESREKIDKIHVTQVRPQSAMYA